MKIDTNINTKHCDLQSLRTPKISDVPDFIHCPYFVTGSVKFGCAKRSSDLDIAIPINYKSSIFKSKYFPSEYNAGFKFMHNGICLNIIPLHPLDYVAWNHASKIICTLGLFINPMPLSKYKRYSLHEMYIAASKMAIGQYNIDFENYEEFLKF
jgi:hypothetical protein